MTDIGDPYRVLGLPPGASLDDVKRAYRRLAKRYHPDSTGGAATAAFLAVQAAYEALVSRTSGSPRGVAATNRRPTSRPAPGARPRPSGPGRAASGTSGASGTAGTAGRAGPRGAPWEADPDRARATRDAQERYRAGRATGAPPSDARGSAGRPAGGPVHRSVRKARLGSTSYDDAATESREPQWGGATWYGQASGTYWTINPKEYADPRKHGPEYQARGRRRPGGDAPRAGWVAPESTGPGRPAPKGGDDQAPWSAAATTSPDGRSAGAARGRAEGDAGGLAAADAGASGAAGATDTAWRPAAGATDAAWRPAAGATEAAWGPAVGATDAASRAAAGRTDAGPAASWTWRDRPAATGATAPGATQGGRTDGGATARPTDGAPSPAGTVATPPAHLVPLPARVTLALIAWPVIGLAVAGVIGALTGCDRFAASCPRPLDLGPLAVQPLIVALLLLIPPLAEVAAVGTVAVALAAIPATVLLSAMGSPRGRAGEAPVVLLAILAIAYLAGVAAAVAGRARIPDALRGR